MVQDVFVCLLGFFAGGPGKFSLSPLLFCDLEGVDLLSVVFFIKFFYTIFTFDSVPVSGLVSMIQ